MNDRLQEVERWFERLADLEPPERARELETLAQKDAALAGELRTLLVAHQRQSGRLESLFSRLSPAAQPRSRVGDVVGPYRIESLAGAGGMGVVYRAQDTRLVRTVALKFLPDWLGDDPVAKDRFVTEARAVSGLDHPNICTLHEIGETDDGALFLVMPFYVGETLAARLGRGPLAPEQATDITRQVARGLAAAHARGIVHRDIKPGNLFCTTDGLVKILDFGIAKANDIHLTRTGERLGTLQYMAPEQLAGESVDGRADLWSLGVVLHEMLTGIRPQIGQASSTTLRTAPAALADLVARMLQVDPDRRLPDVGSLISALDQQTPAMSRHRRGQPITGWALAAVTALLLGGAWLSGRSRAPLTASTAFLPGSDLAAMAVAVLPFRVVGEGMESWRDGIMDLLPVNLDGLGGLRKVDPNAVAALWNAQIGAGRDAPSLTAALEVSRSLGARFAITGSVVGAGSAVRLTVDVHDLTRDGPRGSAVIDGDVDSMFALLDGLVVELVRRQLVPVDADVPPISLERVTTSSVPALKAYLEGEAAYRLAQWPVAIDAFQRAVALDSAFARAHLRLSSALTWVNDTRGRDAHLALARQHGDRLTERDRQLAAATTIPQLAQFVARYPDEADGWSRYGDALFHGGPVHLIPVARYRSALETATRLLPYYGESYAHLIEDAFARHDSAAVRGLLAGMHLRGTGNRTCRVEGLLFDARWGSSEARRLARTGLDSLPEDALRCGWTALPVFPDANERMEQFDRHTMITAPSNLARAMGLWRSVHARVLRGEISAASSLLSHADTIPILAPLAAHFGSMLGLAGYLDAASERHWRARLEPTRDYQDAFWLGAWAVHDQSWQVVESQAVTIDSALLPPVGGDTTETVQLGAALREYAALMQDDWSRLAAFEAALATLPTASVRYEYPGLFLHHMVGQRLLAAGRFADAERYAASVTHYEWLGFVPAQLALGRLAERRGDNRTASRHYALAAEWWQGADPGLHAQRDSALVGQERLQTSSEGR